MGDEVHYIPVGFDFERLVQPLHYDDFDPDRIVLLYSEQESNRKKEAELAENIASQLKSAVESVLGTTVETEIISDIFNYKSLYEYAYKTLTSELDEGNTVFVNISSMPRTVAFAYATAANTHVVERPQMRGKIHTYYSSPEDYLMINAIEELESVADFLKEKDFSQNIKPGAEEHLESISSLLDDLEKGTTSGTRQLPNEKYHVEFIAPPVTGITESEEEALQVLQYMEEAESISELARQHAEWRGIECDNSHKNKVRYWIENLIEKGLVVKKEEGKRHRIKFSRIGEMWAATNDQRSNSEFL
ncbi:HFX_2341 family transcriptional regulator domain-containing protein [Halostagnicola kamekurae]|uniref:HFX-2341-like N-terminal domain-containing protein n=1 Tax=Halostagnicola kamekurae TaxID=619731 RepID=A0A1I6US42_9EURY|nr:DUF6293 family protein [Halostagnicola kamekurae]SFT04246.1 hypothetical protein SAMN04488556_4036 [Halostagnicola kamekurae]